MLNRLRENKAAVVTQFRLQKRFLAIVYIPLVAFLLVLTFQRSVPLHLLVADTANLAGIPVYIGMLSNLGIVIWGAAFAVCVFAAATLGRQSEWTRFFTGAAVLSLIFLIDDMFMLHDRILPAMGIPEMLYIPFYLGAIIAFAVGLWGFIRKTAYTLLLLAVMMLGASVAFDVSSSLMQKISGMVYNDAVLSANAENSDISADIDESRDSHLTIIDREMAAFNEGPSGLIPRGNLSALAEDGLKFLGIAGWLLYLGVTARKQIMEGFGVPVTPAVSEPSYIRSTLRSTSSKENAFL